MKEMHFYLRQRMNLVEEVKAINLKMKGLMGSLRQ